MALLRQPPLLLALLLGSCLAEEWALTLVDVALLKCNMKDYYRLRMEKTQESRNLSNSMYAVSIFRTSPEPVKVFLSMLDADGNVVIMEHSVELKDLSREENTNKQSRRRVSEDIDAMDGSSCEDFFLWDGRDPIELPDNWREAFNDYPAGEEVFEGDDELCQSLLKHGTVFLPDLLGFPRSFRRLKGGFGAAGGGRSGNPGSQPAGGRVFTKGEMSYGYSVTSLSRNYPRSNSFSTTYGYSGRGGLAPIRATTVAGAIVVTAVIFGSAAGVGDYGSARAGRHATRCLGRDCSDESECPPESPCGFELAHEEDLTRDDLLATTAVNLQEHRGPFELRIHDVSGNSFATSRICPPSWWNGKADNSYFSWTPPDQQDLFVALTKVDEMIWEEDEGMDPTGPVIVSVLLVLVMCMGLYFFLQFRKNAQRTKELVEMLEQRRAERLKFCKGLQAKQVEAQCQAPAIKEELVMIGASTSKQDREVPVQYEFKFLADGTFTGTCTIHPGDDMMKRQQRAVEGCVQSAVGPVSIIMWKEGPTQWEARGVLWDMSGQTERTLTAHLIEGDTDAVLEPQQAEICLRSGAKEEGGAIESKEAAGEKATEQEGNEVGKRIAEWI